ncbi:hypothetical protein PoB_002105600 [Plakobranchus ocellatus]|uniref:Uncharacterized protein n=1 Tax=Plakobranchus ocellatus TaxID=259542 RepID=A0AAV3Z5G2_9GAST|nr:hypothetical protein PoB_002105600 [Plakobranchus ocellatus]
MWLDTAIPREKEFLQPRDEHTVEPDLPFLSDIQRIMCYVQSPQPALDGKRLTHVVKVILKITRNMVAIMNQISYESDMLICSSSSSFSGGHPFSSFTSSVPKTAKELCF